MIDREHRDRSETKLHEFWIDRVPTPVGDLVIVTDAIERLRAADFWDAQTRMKRLLRLHYGLHVTLHSGGAPRELRERLTAYFAGELAAIDTIVTETGGTEFQRAVWAELRRTRPGEKVTYRELAARVGRPRAIRAVGHANGSNPVCVVIPCHRVVGAKNSLTGYGGGVERKRWLLVHEGAWPSEPELSGDPPKGDEP